MTEIDEQAASVGTGAEPASDELVELPAIALTDSVVLPQMIVPIHLDAWAPIQAIEMAMLADKRVYVAPRTQEGEDPEAIGRIGVIATVEESRPSRRGGQRVVVRGVDRALLDSISQEVPYLRVKVQVRPDPVTESPEARELMNELLAATENMVEMNPDMPSQEILSYVRAITEPGLLADHTAYSPECTFDERIKILEALDPLERLRIAFEISRRHLHVQELRSKIREDVKTSVDKAQREFVLREQLRAIQRELGEGEGEGAIADELREKIEAANMPEAAEEKALRELARLAIVGMHSAEQGVIRTYLEWLTELPWSVSSDDHDDISEAARVLNEDHYGLDKVKERILEYIAVRALAGAKMRSPILCFVGPPGVGKTSLGRSIAKALGRNFWRTSLGGVRDEAEIRGHRRTYVGALPGRIIQGIRNAKSNNPVFMLDEIDKVGNDFRGDPSAALLEVLDPEQNFAFSDHYLEVPFDLSKVIFILTANVLDTIPPALRDRMEVISLPGYTEDEKLQIAEQFLVPKQREAHGLETEQITIPQETLQKIVSGYTREAGVRNLEREIATLCRKVARRVVAKEDRSGILTPDDLGDLLGPEKFTFNLAEEEDEIGTVTGVAWTETGGELLSIEVSLMEGKGDPILTGHLGKVMQESARAALTYARSHARELGIDPAFFDDHAIHVHVPAGGVPKDGPSAGIALTTALISALSGRPVRKDVAMTGEVTLRGRVLPIGGLKEKMLAAHRAGIKTFLLPKRNAKDLVDLPEKVREMEIVEVDHMEEVLERALVGGAKATAPSAKGQKTSGKTRAVPTRGRKVAARPE
ncbi:MAG: endopeptidase La [Candidatus Handelsmanbacteria bacterium RIFCSPLOWO2_12_FULL_64_10]|uniref:Lon protease n=1 Tax=Handelsmanbacteria sp. (strain RIFCSPLOWO2_12_FULL_64_10) TaxID=1817868 RepID=A0A1F6CBS9_HANXR|nr:MAG: endopeptidase La [Candidatus Handelsmanbacteria bacterium RIFCSPLOWO2_12_FULL_64_10]